MRLSRLILLAILLVGTSAVADQGALELRLEGALRKRAALDTLRRYSLTLESPGSSLERRVSILSKEYGDRVYVLGAFFHPRDLRGTAFLAIDKPGKSDRFVYFPAFRIVRRVGAQQKSDSWFGTDLSLEDIEYRPVKDFEILGQSEGVLNGAVTLRVDTRPRYGSAYERIRFHLAAPGDIVVKTEYFLAGREDPSKVVDAQREGLRVSGEWAVPAVVTCTNLETGSRTIVKLDEVVFSPKYRREYFGTQTLEVWSKLKSLE